MTDRAELQKTIVAKVRDHADFLKHNVATWQLLARAADEIERLQAEIERLREALQPFAYYYDLNDCHERKDDDALEVPIGDLKRAASAYQQQKENCK